MNQDEAPVIRHDDGIFEFPKKLEHRVVGLTEFAKEVISSYKEKERIRVGKLKKPITRPLNLPIDIVMEDMRKRAGDISFAPTQLHQWSTVSEHENAKHMEAFYMNVEPDYEDRDSATKYHGDYCWKVALLNAFRILEMLGDQSIKFPFGWVRICVDPQDRNFVGLLGSAAFQMGLYYAKAQAMPKAVAAIRGKKMAQAKKGHYTDLGEIVYAACEEIEKRDGILPSRNASARVMAILEERKKGSTKGALYKVFVDGKEEIITSKKLGKFIRRYRERVG